MAAVMVERGTIRGIHVLIGVLAFFGVIFFANGVFLYFALKTHTGIVSKQPYRKGLDYNERIAAGERQKALGWQDAVTIDRQAGTIELVLKDAAGLPVSGLTIEGFVGRPATEQFDIAIAMKEGSTPGTYRTSTSVLEPGNWVVKLQAFEMQSSGPATVYRLRKRLWLKP